VLSRAELKETTIESTHIFHPCTSFPKIQAEPVYGKQISQIMIIMRVSIITGLESCVFVEVGYLLIPEIAVSEDYHSSLRDIRQTGGTSKWGF
jgi:hypothetical protein